ncbi:MAG: hypothetical protein KDA79_24555, partial [Planctomycetaceae bacterium]|nr:hypothetical protein [Planctomycetaceae bacterium]
EINNERLGWLIELPLSQASYAPLKTEGERVEVSEMIASGLERAIREIISRPDVIREKGHWSLERIRQMHDPKTHSLLLRDLYQSAMLV